MSLRTLLLGYSFYYPLTMSFIWIIGGLFYFLRLEHKASHPDVPPRLDSWPRATLVVPCHNEAETIRDTVESLADQDYPDFEIIAIDDASNDASRAILNELLGKYPNLRVLHFPENQGKAMGLRMAALAANSDFLICIDGDSLLDRYATRWLMWHMVTGPRVGAVTGNPRVRNRSTLLGRLQVGEFSSIIGLIKRAQRIFGRIFTVSGVIAAYRISALHQAGYWSTDIVTEDIDISWRMQMNFWDIRYEPNALCWILMPETLRGLWRQRLRWALGGAQVALRYARNLFDWRKRRMWFVTIEYALSVLWSYVMLFVLIISILGTWLAMPRALHFPGPIPGWYGVVLSAVCVLQFLVSMLIDRRYEKSTGRQFFWIIWYPLVFWMVGMITAVVSLPIALYKQTGVRAVWESPDRGIR
ncbi:MAG TPA: poly-beta-1,6-N-acetyl-D-glucosamine synthase [Terracidiphilus sp.]|nr:poly-beta-1,6-N-acetyl-D-glucosamine synthase [Terracidiphilus sp.]